MLTHHFAEVNGVRLHYVEAGQGPLVVLLHGFPEFWYCWRHQLPALAAAGFRAIAPDLRGYNDSDKPSGVASYRLDRLTADVVGLIQHAGVARAHVVAHDWGGGIAWNLAAQHPAVVDRLAILNSPHPAAFLREFKTVRQLLKSWYMFFFQLPWLPEWWMRRGDFAGLAQTFLNDPVRPGAFTPEDVERYREAFRKPGALTAAINYYRAMFRYTPVSAVRAMPVVQAPTLLIWGDQDRYLNVRLTEGMEPYVPNLRIEHLNASHWVQNDAVERVNELLIDFLKPPSTS